MNDLKGDIITGVNPATDRPNHASSKPTWSFHERYNTDAEFKRQVDEARKRSKADRGHATLISALESTRPGGRKLY